MKNKIFYIMAVAATIFLTAACIEKKDYGVKVTGVKIYPTSSVSLDVGETATFTATVLPVNATEQTVYWGSEDPNIATVDQNGLVRAIRVGSTHIYVSTKEGAYWERCSVWIYR